MWGKKEEIEKGSDDVTKTRFVKLCDWLAYPERKDEKISLARNQPNHLPEISQIGEEI